MKKLVWNCPFESDKLSDTHLLSEQIHTSSVNKRRQRNQSRKKKLWWYLSPVAKILLKIIKKNFIRNFCCYNLISWNPNFVDLFYNYATGEVNILRSLRNWTEIFAQTHMLQTVSCGCTCGLTAFRWSPASPLLIGSSCTWTQQEFSAEKSHSTRRDHVSLNR